MKSDPVIAAFLSLGIALAAFVASAEDYKPYPRKPLPEELEVYRALLERQSSETPKTLPRRFRVCDVSINKDKDRGQPSQADPTQSGESSSLAQPKPDASGPDIAGFPPALLKKLIIVNRRTPMSPRTSSELVHEEGELLWMYVPCRDLFPTFVSKLRMPNLFYMGNHRLTFSRVAFDQNRTMALVYSWFDGGYGEEQVVTMLTKNESGTWTIARVYKW